MTTEEARAAINAAMMIHNITMTAAFVPQSLSRNSGEKEHTLNWRVSFANSVNKQSFALDYSQGIGHVPGGWKEARTLYEESRAGKPWEIGFYNPRPKQSAMLRKKLSAPHAADILHSIVLDVSSAQESFEDWAIECGYDTDSRKAEEIYRACVKESRDAHRVFGSAFLKEAETILQDY